ncbi:lipase [Nocardia sp. BMG51109]|uniref:lipase family alpha/beta hydrolase n=1 Tax=Nocardia sp. BMG51109 TaxID=1056816 RepID=UPI000467E656|nr:lipase [Nocardia sp. BMG51109]
MRWRCLFLGLGAALATSVLAAPAHATTEPRGVVIVVPGQFVGALPYGPMADTLRADGYLPVVLDLKGFAMAADAEAVARAVDTAAGEHPDTPISLVTHSVGAVSSRYYLRALGGGEKVDTYIAMGAPQYGSPGGCGQPVGAEVCPGSEFMTALNAGDDTPGTTAYYSVRSEREWTDGRLDGGQCRMTPFPTLGNGGADHTLEAVLPPVLSQVRTALTGDCAGDYVDEPDGAISADATLFPSGIPFG